MKKNFSYEDRRLAEQLFDIELDKVFLNFKARLRNAPPEEKDEIIINKEKEIVRRFVNKHIY